VIPAELGQLTKLEGLYTIINKVKLARTCYAGSGRTGTNDKFAWNVQTAKTGTLPKTLIPSDFGNLMNLRTLYVNIHNSNLRSNRLRGSIPHEIGHLKNLLNDLNSGTFMETI
jgi:hypothetical protein